MVDKLASSGHPILDALRDKLIERREKFTLGSPGTQIIIRESGLTIQSETPFIVIITKELLNRPFIVVNVNNEGIIFVGSNKGGICQTNELDDVINLLYSNKVYLHHIYERNPFPLIFLQQGVLFSPELYNSVRTDAKSTIYDYTNEELKNDLHTKDLGLTSSRGFDFGIYASKLRANEDTKYKPDAEKLLYKSDMELAFESVRRDVCFWAPSRLSGFYLVSDDMNDRLNLRTMFSREDRKSLLVEVKTTALMTMIKVDYRWVEQYHEDPKAEYIVNYWNSKPFCDNSTTWEYLYEGMLEASNSDQLEYLKGLPVELGR